MTTFEITRGAFPLAHVRAGVAASPEPLAATPTLPPGARP